MSFFKYLFYRIAARQGEKVIYSAFDGIKNNIITEEQFPSRSKAISSGMLHIFSLVFWHLIIFAGGGGLIGYLIWSFLYSLLICQLLMATDTFGYTLKTVHVTDRRFKSGFRAEYHKEIDRNVRVELSRDHRDYNRLEAVFLVIGILIITYLQFYVYPTVISST